MYRFSFFHWRLNIYNVHVFYVQQIVLKPDFALDLVYRIFFQHLLCDCYASFICRCLNIFPCIPWIFLAAFISRLSDIYLRNLETITELTKFAFLRCRWLVNFDVFCEYGSPCYLFWFAFVGNIDQSSVVNEVISSM